MFTLQGAILGFGRMAPWAHSSDDLHGQLYCQLSLGGQVRIGTYEKALKYWIELLPFQVTTRLEETWPR